jgi:hypothetical protein
MNAQTHDAYLAIIDDAEARYAALEAAARAMLTDGDPAAILANEEAYGSWVRHRAAMALLLEDGHERDI